MPLQKQNVAITFGRGVDTKTDPNQIPIGSFAALENSVFTTTNRLTKRNGYNSLTSLPNNSFSYLTTFNGNLTAVGSTLEALNSGNSSWMDQGKFQPVSLSTIPLVRNSLNQFACDSITASNGSVCVAYSEEDPSGTIYYYAVVNGTTSQSIVSPTAIAASESPRVFLLGNYFIILYSSSGDLNYVSVPVNNPLAGSSPVTLVINYAAGQTQLAFDGVVFNNTLYISYNGNDVGHAIRSTGLNSFLVAQTSSSGVVIANTKQADMVSVCVDTLFRQIWTSWYKTSGTTGFSVAMDPSFNIILAATQIISSGTILNITSTAANAVLSFYYEVSNNYSYDSGVASHFIKANTLTIGGSLGSATTPMRSVGLASKAFLINYGTAYFLVTYSSPYQPTYFLADVSGNIIAKLAYSNGGGYLVHGLPNISVSNTEVSIPYLFKDLITAVNKNTNVPTGSQVNGIYSQLGINLASFDISATGLNSAEIGANLNFTGGFLWSYDGSQVTENNFFVYPDSIEATWAATGGAIHAQPDGITNANAYFYQVTYEWTDNQGNAFRSAPSIPIAVTTTGSGTIGSITVNVPMLRLTYKTNVKICIYRWSVAQQIYYQVTSITTPTISSKTSDSVAYVDTLADPTILANNVLYTTGGVIEDIGPPSFSAITLFNTRLFGIEAEDRNTLWFSKQVISNTPVEMSDLFTIYTPPTTGAQASTGPNSCLFPMDDKLILFKENAGLYYITGNGPDNTGANSDFSNAIFITSTVGCANQASIVFIPQGLIFQDGTGKGLWLLGRNLSTEYIGAPVEQYNSETITSAFALPGTNQVAFTLSSGTILVYDYYQGQWNTFGSLSAISSCLYQEKHTFIDSVGRCFQQTPGSYVDGSSPVLMSLKTSWISLASGAYGSVNLSGLQNFQRAYEFYLLANYYSPHKLTVSIAYDYNPSPTQVTVITPSNYSPPYGSDPVYGISSPYGGSSNVEQARIFFQNQQCQAFQVTIQESFDASYGTAPGAGFSLSGLNLVVGLKKNYPRLSAAVQYG